MNKKTKRSLAYVGIIGGTAVLAMTFFIISQYEKAKYKASETVRLSSETKITTTAGEEKAWWIEVNEDFTKISKKNASAYVGTAVPAYTFSMATLVAFGLVLKHAEKVKEQEEKEVTIAK
ncbi:MAG: hypothetical protein K6E11_03610 [Bacilli bacterium]|nr:hypothetical protein [Bacilli bacterium]